ncbi:MAG TPA: tetratricopeptide repeat protein [Alphaproteobacteria bacterium]
MSHASRLVLAFAAALSLGACATATAPNESAAPYAAIEPVPIPRLLEAADNLLAREQYKSALRFYVQVLDREPDNAAARLGVAESYLGLGAAPAAEAAFAAIEDVPAFAARARQGKGLAALRQGDHARAGTLLRDALARDDTLWRAHLGLARILDGEARWREAAAAYARAAELNPDAAAIHNNWGMSLLAQGDYAGAEAKFARALELAPDLEAARNNYRFAIALQGRYREAFAGASDRDLPAVLNNVGYAAMMRGDKDRARSYFARALEASPHFLAVAHENLQLAKGQGEPND